MAINIKNDALKLWEKSGKSEFQKQLKISIKDNSSPLFYNINNVVHKNNNGGIFKVIYNMLSQTIHGQIKKDTLLHILYDISTMHTDMPSILLDIIGIIDAETSTLNISGNNSSNNGNILNSGNSGSIDILQQQQLQQYEERQIFCQIVKELEKLLSDKLLKERLEIDTLQDVGTIKNKNFYTKFIKIKTKLYYKQRRFNLFREESEGYAKLITELNQEEIIEEKQVTVDKMLEMIKSLIGCFNLDPNRVLDIILESFETRPEQHVLFISLLKKYMPNGIIISEVLGYKYRYFSDTKTPNSLYIITALLLQYKIINLNDIYTWLSPTDKQLQFDWDQELFDAKEYVRKLNIISTNRDKDKEEENNLNVNSTGSISNGNMNNNNNNNVVDKDDVDDNKYSMNQKWNLLESVLNCGDWQTAQQLFDKLPKDSCFVQLPIAKALSSLIHNCIQPIYVQKCLTTNKNSTNSANQLIPNLNITVKTIQIPQAIEFIDLHLNAFPMAIKLGPSLYNDPVLIYKLIRLMRAILISMHIDVNSQQSPPQHQTDDNILYFDILTILDSSILPALSYMDCNCCIAEEIWSVIKYFPYHYRYSLYGRWKNDTYLIHPKLIRRRGAAQKAIKALMKRVSKENVKPVGRLIGKLSHSSPGFLFDYILLQIQIYDNLIAPVVDSLKYLTSISYDVLGYCLIEALAQADRNRFKHDGTSLSMWLQSLANFCGSIYKKYNIELSGLLQYVCNQLKAQKSLDLLILKEIVQKMSGIEATEEMTIEQLNAMSGGELLRSEAGYFSQIRNTKKSSQRLKDALASNDLAVTLCLLMAQQKHCVIYRETANNHLKLVGKLYDQCQDTLIQFGIFLSSTYSVDEYVERLPSIHNMLQEYHIHSDVAFFLARPMFTHQINQKYDQLRKLETPLSKKLTTIQKQEKYLEATDSIILPIVNSVRPLHSQKIWEDISPQFLVTFWSLSMYDLQVPNDSYQKEITKLKQLSISVMDSKDMNQSKGRKEQERYLALIDKLQDERKKQQEHVDKIMHRLNHEKDLWFLSRSAKSAKNETITQFLQLCLFPRCTFTALDAVYCAKFVHTIHNLKTSNFSTLLCYDRIFCDITYSVTSCTENEATRYGRFLCAMLETVMKWHENPVTFNKECANYPGFVTKYRVSNQFSEANDLVGYENYRHVCHKWHYKITKAMVFCLDSKDYMQIRNALIILMRILPYFPMLVKLSQIIEKKVEKVREEERNHRQDLFVLASSYIGQLKNKSNDMIREIDFHQVSDKPNKDIVSVTTATATIATSSTASTSTQSSATATIPATTSSLPSTYSSITTTTSSSLSSSITPTTNDIKSNNNGNEGTIKKELSRNEKRLLLKQQLQQQQSFSSSNNIDVKRENSLHKEIRIDAKDIRKIDDDIEIRSNNSSSSNRESNRDGSGGRNESKEKRREQRERDRDRDRDRERKTISPASFYEHSSDRYYSSNSNNNTNNNSSIHYEQQERDLSSISNSSNGSTLRRSHDSPDIDRELKRRKLELLNNKRNIIDELILSSSTTQQQDDGGGGGGSSSTGKKERASKSRDKRDKLSTNDGDGDYRKEKKVGRKRDRLGGGGGGGGESSSSNEQKRRKDDDKNINGSIDDEIISRDKHYHGSSSSTRDKSPYTREQRDRTTHDDSRDKQYSFSKSSRTRTSY